MKRTIFRRIFLAAAAGGASLWLAGCSSRTPLPVYEPPMARTQFQNVRTTAYTHTESDHVKYGNRNALGGRLRAAGPAVATGYQPTAIMYASTPSADDGLGGFHRPARAQSVIPPARSLPVTPPAPVPDYPAPAVYGSAAADWSRWPAGTTFRILSTGQYYRVDDYGWALAGRNTIDLYKPSRAAMNAWGVRREPIQILQWGDPAESLRLLRRHQEYRHIRRMVLELEGRHRAAANLD